MAYFLKKTKLKGRTYLSIDESFYNHEKKGTSHRCYKSLGSVETWKEKGLSDPIAHFQKEVDALNQGKERAGTQKISDASTTRYLGYFPLKAILEKLQIKKYMGNMHLKYDSGVDLYELLTSLIYTFAVYPSDKQIAFDEVFSGLYNSADDSYGQLTGALSFLGGHYEEFVGLFADRISHVYGVDTSKTYFCCTDFYFENAGEEGFLKKDMVYKDERENIFGIRVLLDSWLIPFDIKIYPRNETEKPALQETFGLMKSKNHVDGKTVHMAGKGYNSARNVTFSRENGQGYLYVKNIKGLSETEKAWILQEDDFTEVKDKEGKLTYRYKTYIDEFPYKAVRGGKEYTVKMREKHVLIYDPSMALKKRHEINQMVEKARTLYTSGARRSAYGPAGKYVNSDQGESEGAGEYINWEAVSRDLKFAGYMLFVTSETEMDGTEIVQIHYDLRKIENTFEFVKFCLEANLSSTPDTEAIKGCFMVAYLTILLKRVFQVKILEDKYSGDDISRFIREFRVIKGETRYINMTKSTELVSELAEKWGLPLMDYFLTESQIKAILRKK